MSYEVDRIKEIECLCGNGKIKQITESNDWNQTQEYIEIDCENCLEKYEIVTEYFCTKPKHDCTVYYCKNKETGEKIQLDL